MTLATEIYYTGIKSLYHGARLYGQDNRREGGTTTHVLLVLAPENRDYIKKSLIQAGRADLLDKLYGG